MAMIGTVTRHWVCPKCTATFMVSESYFKGFRAFASAKVSQQLAARRIRHRQLGCARDRPRSLCFITSACVKHMGLADDCYELEVLRRFRDRYLLPTDAGQALTSQYYRIAPLIVQAINRKSDSPFFWKDIYDNLVRPTVHLIEQGSDAIAEQHYKGFVLHLAKELNIVQY